MIENVKTEEFIQWWKGGQFPGGRWEGPPFVFFAKGESAAHGRQEIKSCPGKNGLEKTRRQPWNAPLPEADVPAFIEAMFRFCAAKTYGKETEK